MQAAGPPKCEKNLIETILCGWRNLPPALNENMFNLSVKKWSRSILCNVLLWQLYKKKKFTAANSGNWRLNEIENFPWDLATFTTRRRAMNERVVLAFIFFHFWDFDKGQYVKGDFILEGILDLMHSILMCIKDHWPVHFSLWLNNYDFQSTFCRVCRG